VGTKNNPKNRAGTSKSKSLGGKEVEPAMFYDFGRGTRYLSAKIAKTNDIVCGGDGRPVKWKDLASD
jgi:hypothetical protein